MIRASKGFTLVELLVAMFITAIVFAMGYGAINQSLNDRDALRTRQDRLNALQNAFRIMSQDFSQIAPRPIRDVIGDTWQPAIRATKEANAMLVFTRAGWANPAGIQRPALQRVSYVLDNGTLRRLHWLVLDGTQSEEPIQRDLLDRVRAVSLRYMNIAKQWQDEWPPNEPGDPEASLRARPLAIEVTIELEDWGRIVRIIEVGT